MIDPIDGSLNAKRGLPHHALSVAVASGPTMADVEFGYVYDFGPAEEWWALRGGGAWLDGRVLDPAIGERRARDGRLEVLGIESADPRWVALSIDVARRRRIPPAGARDDRVLAVPGRRRRFDGLLSLRGCRSVDAAAGQLIVREAGGRGQLRRFRGPARGAAGPDPACAAWLPRATAATLDELERDRAGERRGMAAVIDWIVAERIAWLLARGGGTAPLQRRPRRAGGGVRAARRRLHRARARGGRSRRRRASAAASGSPATSPRCAALIDPVLERAGQQLGPLAPMLQIGARPRDEHRGRRPDRLPRPARARPVRARAARRASPSRRRRGCCSCCRTSAHAVTSFGADEREFLTWVALHEVTHAVQFGGVPWLHVAPRRPRAGAARERRGARRRSAARSGAAGSWRRCGAVAGQARRGDLISIVAERQRARDDRSRPGGDGGDRGARRARHGRRRARSAALAAAAAGALDARRR